MDQWTDVSQKFQLALEAVTFGSEALFERQGAGFVHPHTMHGRFGHAWVSAWLEPAVERVLTFHEGI